MDAKDATTAPLGAPQPGAPPSSPPAHRAMDMEGKDATNAPLGAPQPGAHHQAMEGKDASAASLGAPQPGAHDQAMDDKDAAAASLGAPQPGAHDQAMEGKDAAAASLGAPQPGAHDQAMEGKDAAAASAPEPQPQAGEPQPAERARWGTRQMGPPAAPGAHPENQQAAQGTASRGDQELPPYVIMGEPVPAPAPEARRTDKEKDSPMEHILDFFNTWSRKAEELSSNIWLNLKTAPSMSDAAMGKLSLGAKAITGGGFEKLYKQTFASGPDEHVKKTFACYLSTATGPVAGTLYLTNLNVAFCSDRPLSFAAPSGQTAWSYYKVVLPLARVAAVEPVTAKESPPERYVHVVTVDSHDFWFMGFVSYDKAVHHLVGSVQHGAAPAPAQAAAPTADVSYE